MIENNLASGINRGIFKYIGSNQRILSVGCGSALLEAEAKKKGNTVYGIDISEESIKKAGKVLDRVFVCDLEKIDTLPFNGETFDIIILGDVIEHLLEPGRILKLIKPCLKEGGYIIASIPNVANWTVRIPLLFGRFNYGEEGIVVWQHYRFYTKRSACRLIEQIGYTITTIDYTTSIVNVTYDFIKNIIGKINNISGKKINRELNKQNKQNVRNISGREAKSSFLLYLKNIKNKIKQVIEAVDSVVTKFFPGLFALQFIIIAKKK